MHELKVIAQKKRVKDYQTRGILRVKGYDTKEMLTLTKFHTLQRETTKVSIQDCSVWLYAMDKGYTLLTGDAKLKSAATKTGVDVHGIIYVIDKLVDMLLISKDVAADKLEELFLLNQRLPILPPFPIRKGINTTARTRHCISFWMTTAFVMLCGAI